MFWVSHKNVCSRYARITSHYPDNFIPLPYNHKYGHHVYEEEFGISEDEESKEYYE